MRTRHFLEVELSQAIKQGNPNVAAQLIQQILDYKLSPKPSLTSCDDNGNSFLAQAIEVGLRETVSRLWRLQRTTSDILFGENKESRTLGHQLAACGRLDRWLSSWLLVADKIISADTGYPLWMRPDGYGYTILHAAVKQANEESSLLLIQFIKEKNRLIEMLHARTLLGDTPLHLAMSSYSLKNILLLLQNGAQLLLTNNENKSPLDFLLKKQPETQIRLFSQLDAVNQSIILQRYYSELQQHPDDEVLNEIYAASASRHSLSSLLLGHFSFNYDVSETSLAFVDTKTQEALDLLKTRHSREKVMPLFNLEMERDREKLNCLLQDIEHKVADWLTRTTPLRDKVKAVMVPSLGFAAGLSLFAWKMVDLLFNEPTGHVIVTSIPFWHIFQYIIVFFAAILFAIFSANIAIKYSTVWFRAEPIISHHEWQQFWELLDKEVLASMRIAVQDKDCKAPWLQIGQELLAFEMRFNEDLKKTEAIELFQSVSDKIVDLRKSLSLSNRSFSFFTPLPIPPKVGEVQQIDDVVIDMDDESVPLLMLGHA